MVDSQKLAAVFVELADSLVDDFDPLDLLHVLTTRCVEMFGVAAAGLMLTEHDGELRVVVSSSQQARLLELFQLQNDEGPCLDCYRTGQPVLATGLDQPDSPWPNFAAATTRAGFTTVLALPMRLRGQVIGALNLFATPDNAPMSPQETRIAQALADAATITLLQERLLRSRTIVTEQLQTALNSRITIEQAKGVLSARLNISADQAFDLLRTRARNNRQRLTDVAEDVAAGSWTAYVSDPPAP